MGLRVAQAECRAPRAAEQQPAFDAEVAAQRLDVVDQQCCGISGQAAMRTRPARATLVEQHHAPVCRVEEAAMHRSGPGTGTAVQEQDRLSRGMADLFPVDRVAVADPKEAEVVGTDLGKQLAARLQLIMSP